jgi:hypothetical protein
MPAVKPLRAASFVAVALAIALPASASAATLTLDKSCYREGSDALGTGMGFAPNSQPSMTLDGSPYPTDPNNPPTANTEGTVLFDFGVGTPPGKQRKHVLGMSDGTNSAQATFTATDLDVIVTPTRGTARTRKRVKARGFDQGRILYFHVRGPRKKNGKVGKAKRPCGKVNKKVKFFKATFPIGTYRVQFDQRRKYKRAPTPEGPACYLGPFPRCVFEVKIFRVVKPSIAGAAFSAGETWTPLD